LGNFIEEVETFLSLNPTKPLELKKNVLRETFLANGTARGL